MRGRRGQARAGDEADESGRCGRGEVAPVAERGRGDADHEIADDPAGERDGEGEHDDAEEIEPGADTGQAAGEPEDERPREVQDEDQVGIKADDHRCSLSAGATRLTASAARVRRVASSGYKLDRMAPLAGGPRRPDSLSGGSGMTDTAETDSVLSGLDAITGDLEDLYRDVHQHPELSMQEHNTAAKAAERLRSGGVRGHRGRREHRCGRGVAKR